MKVNVEFEDGDFDSLHDTIFDLINMSYPHDKLKLIWESLPEDIKSEGIRWGLSDSVVRDSTYEYLVHNLDKIK